MWQPIGRARARRRDPVDPVAMDTRAECSAALVTEIVYPARDYPVWRGGGVQRLLRC